MTHDSEIHYTSPASSSTTNREWCEPHFNVTQEGTGGMEWSDHRVPGDTGCRVHKEFRGLLAYREIRGPLAYKVHMSKVI